MAGRSSIYDSALKSLREAADILKASVINDIGDFAHVITISGKEFNLKVQIPRAVAEDSPPVVSLQSPHLDAAALSRLSADLLAVTAAHTAAADLPTRLCALARAAVAASPTSSDTPALTPAGSKSQQPAARKTVGGGGGGRRREADAEKRRKKASMKTAADVVKRVLWDDAIPADLISIGYVDRFRGLLEKPFAAFSWEDLASIDYFTFAVPKHRIQYFKYKRRVVWEKTRRLDNVFGSTGSGRTIQQEMDEYRDDEHESEPPAACEAALTGDRPPAACEATLTGDRPPAACEAALTGDRPLAVEGTEFEENVDAYGCSDSESDDGVQVTVLQRQPDVYSESEQEEEEEEEMAAVYANSPFWRDKLRPNFFLCVRVTQPEVRAAVGHVQDVLVEREPRYETCCVPESMLHVTLATMRLENAEEAAQCLQVMKKYADELRSLLPKTPLRIAGLDRFFHRVLYARVHHCDRFLPFVEHLCTVLRSEGIRLMDNHDFVPHMTVMKVSRPVTRLMGTKYIAPDVFSDSADLELGEQPIDSLYLCSMEKARGPDGFYVSPGCITFMKEVL